MENQFENFMSVLKAFHRFHVEYILIGGVALILHGMERLTRDIDVFVKNTSENIDRLQEALNSVFKDDSIKEITQKELKNYPVIRYGTPMRFNIDVLTKIGELYSYDDLEFEIVEYENIPIKIATPKTLLNLKKDTVRERDKIDSQFLIELIQAKNKK